MTSSVPRTSAYPMIPMQTALQTIASSLQPLTPTKVPLQASLHQTLSAPITAPSPIPPFRASIKDGYAIQIPPISPEAPLPISSESLAGSAPPAPLTPNTAAYVTTGAPVPSGTNAVVMVEHTTPVDNSSIRIDKWPTKPGADIRAIGSDVAQGQLVLEKGATVGAAELGILAACGISEVDVITRPIIGVLSTGDELVDVRELPAVLKRNDGRLPPGKIVDSNRPMLLAAVREALPFCEAVDLGLVKDELEPVKTGLEAASKICHVVLTSGGVSMGNRDVIKPALEQISHVHFGRVVMKPGKPLTFATLPEGNRCFVALPGNPVSAFVCFHLAVCVAARRLAGWSEERALGSLVEVSLREELRLDPVRPEYHRAMLEWVEGKGYVATSTGNQTSSRLLSARSANALLALPSREGSLAAGSVVKAYLLSTSQYAGEGY